MFEPLPNPYYNQEKKANPEVATLLRPRDQEISKAYTRILGTIKWMLSKNFSKENRKYVEYTHAFETKDKDFIQDFCCAFCSLTLSLVRDEYLITLTIDQQCLQKGTGVNSNAILRVAFIHTMNGVCDFNIESSLVIKVVDNTLEHFKMREEQYEEERIAWFSK